MTPRNDISGTYFDICTSASCQGQSNIKPSVKNTCIFPEVQRPTQPAGGRTILPKRDTTPTSPAESVREAPTRRSWCVPAEVGASEARSCGASLGMTGGASTADAPSLIAHAGAMSTSKQENGRTRRSLSRIRLHARSLLLRFSFGSWEETPGAERVAL